MPKKSMKKAAAAGTSVFDTIATGGAQYARDVQSVQDVKDAKDAKGANKEKAPMERLNLKIPTDIKEYLSIAAAKESIEQRRNVSLTEYLCALVRADMEKQEG